MATRRQARVVKPIGQKRTGVRTVYMKRDSGQSGDVELVELTATENRTYYPETGKAFNKVVVNVSEYLKPELAVTLNPSTTLYDVTVDTLNQLVITANVTRKTNAIKKVEFFLNGPSVKVITTDVEDGGIFSYTKDFSPATNEKVSLKIIVTDSADKTTTYTKDIVFVGKSYYGTVDSDVVNPDEALIKTLTSALTGTKAQVYSGINMDYGKVVYAYPSSFGSLTSIKDTIHNIDYTGSFTKTTVSVDEITYNCYILKDAAAADNVQISFA